MLCTLVTFLFVSLFVVIECRVCVHKPIKEVNHVHLEPKHVLKKRNTDQPLRIQVHYDQSVRDLPTEKFIIININLSFSSQNTILPKALEYWERALLVKRLGVPIKLSRKCPQNKAYFPPGKEHVHYCMNECENVTTCGEVIVPEEHLDDCRYCIFQGAEPDCHTKRDDSANSRQKGIKNADFVFYVSAMQTDRCNKGATVAYAAHCQQESSFDRPIAGHANLCPDSISTKPQDMETLLSTVKHEIVHALGFSVSLYAYFRDEDGEPLSRRGRNGKPLINEALNTPEWSERVVRKIVRPNWWVSGGVVKKEAYMIVTPRVVEEVRRHFNCDELEGAELEDQGEDGTLLTHWEKRVFENEAMTGTHTQSPVYSRITLALMEDTGWYKANYSLAQPLTWGEGLGCDFAMRSCKEWIDTRRLMDQSIHPFCDKVKKDPLETECTDSRDAVALCNLMEYKEDLPINFQNFDEIPGVRKNGKELSKYGGSVNLADYCPYIQEFTWKSNDVVVRGSQCAFAENMPQLEKNFALEYYGSGSKCFNHNKEMWEEKTCSQVRQWQHWGSGCYKYTCISGRLHLDIANNSYTCFYASQEIKIQRFYNGWLHIGTIVCPRCSEICESRNSKFRCKPEKQLQFTVIEKTYHKDYLTCAADPLPKVSVILLSFGHTVDVHFP
ncbi:leishmanolysin-like peptidase [Leptotrombidium deliense]|uniref:Leishmanolysin-like peptidase n=1 Tax=Leptotrombidium deliense TaxID=299467 RepID=A0A443SU47_9ACAR|nr:leishmanolysin-like peptidase [Leptotrombidium deliense]